MGSHSGLILGIDPGSVRLGVGLVRRSGKLLELVHASTLTQSSSTPLSERLGLIAGLIRSLCSEYTVEAVAVEGVFVQKNIRSALILGQARGAAVATAALLGVPVFEYAPAAVKRSIGAGGRADKLAVRRMVQRWVGGLDADARHDAVDAVAVALCHTLRTGRVVAEAQTATPKARAPLRPSSNAGLKPGQVKSYSQRLSTAYTKAP